MRQDNYLRLKELLIKHEGLRLTPYTDTVGKFTIGVGRNLEDVGITKLEAMYLLNNDVERVVASMAPYAWYNGIGTVRQDVVLSMVFNLGLNGFLKFKKFIKALTEMNYNTAADEMISSKWAIQVGLRAEELATMMRTGRRI